MKLPEAKVDELVAAGHAHPFAPPAGASANGRQSRPPTAAAADAFSMITLRFVSGPPAA